MTSNGPAISLGVAATLVLAVLLGGCTTRIVSAPSSGPQVNTVTAPGNGTVSAIPDQAVMSFGVSAQAKDAKSALDQVSGKADKVSTAIKGAGVADKDIQTQNVSVDPQYGNVPSNSGQSSIVGYQASLSVSAKVRDLASLSKVIGAASSAGVDNVSGPTFSIAEDSVYREQAIAKAVNNARATAAAMAKAAGRSLGGVMSVTSNGDGSPFPRPLTSQSATPGSAASVPIQPGQLDLTANITVVFELK